MSPKCKVSFFFLFKLFTKSSWKSERQLPLQGRKSIKTTTEQLKQSEREKEKETTSNVWHLVLSTGFPRAPLGIESKIYWQTQLLNPRKGSLGAPAVRWLCAVRLWVWWAGSGPGLALPAHLPSTCLPRTRGPVLLHGPACMVLTSVSAPARSLSTLHPKTVLSPALRTGGSAISSSPAPFHLRPILPSPLLWPLLLHSHSCSGPQDPEARLCHERRRGVPLREPKYWLAWHPGTVAMWVFTQVRKQVLALAPTPVTTQSRARKSRLGWVAFRAVNSVKTVILCLSPRKARAGIALSGQTPLGGWGALPTGCWSCTEPPAPCSPVRLCLCFPAHPGALLSPPRGRAAQLLGPAKSDATQGDSLSAQAHALWAIEEKVATLKQYNLEKKKKSTPQQFKTASLKPF